MRQAQEQAKQLAAAAGVSLGPIRSISETVRRPRVRSRRPRSKPEPSPSGLARHAAAVGARGDRLRDRLIVRLTA
ncbi:MAG: SIMPL domain-containing protein [Actinomycetia bacterium]|nr:SIMPL domain-containing protein [Actinomycetes bacterium]